MSLARRTEILVLILAVLSGILGGFAIWPYSHIGTLWFEVLVVALIIGFLLELAWIFLITAISAICLIALAIQQNLPPMPKRVLPTARMAAAPNLEPTFRFALKPPMGPITVAFGGIQYHTFGIPMLINGHRPFSLEYGEGGRLICNVNTYSIGSKQMIRIERNEVLDLPDNWQAKGNDNGIEIVDENLRPMLQLYYESLNVIRIQGIIAVDGRVMLMKGDLEEELPINSPRLPQAIAEFSLPRFFKYPRALFPGVPN